MRGKEICKKGEMLKKIVITGAESTGKSWLTNELADYYNANFEPEFARDYIQNLNRMYTFQDVELIAKKQIVQDHIIANKGELYFFDTWLIITKVWFDKVYGKAPDWLHTAIEQAHVDLFLLCDIDLPWVADSVRENGGEDRINLHKTYIRELKNYNFKYEVVSGVNEVRKENAINILTNRGLL